MKKQLLIFILLILTLTACRQKLVESQMMEYAEQEEVEEEIIEEVEMKCGEGKCGEGEDSEEWEAVEPAEKKQLNLFKRKKDISHEPYKRHSSQFNLEDVAKDFKPLKKHSILVLGFGGYSTILIEHKNGKLKRVRELPYLVYFVGDKPVYVTAHSYCDLSLTDDFDGDSIPDYSSYNWGYPVVTSNHKELENLLKEWPDTCGEAYIYDYNYLGIIAITPGLISLNFSGSEYGGGAHGFHWGSDFAIRINDLKEFTENHYSYWVTDGRMNSDYNPDLFYIQPEDVLTQEETDSISVLLMDKVLEGDFIDCPDYCAGDVDTTDYSFGVYITYYLNSWYYVAFKDIFACYMCSDGDYELTAETYVKPVDPAIAPYITTVFHRYPDLYHEAFISPVQDIIYGIKDDRLYGYSISGKKSMPAIGLPGRTPIMIEWATGKEMDKWLKVFEESDR